MSSNIHDEILALTKDKTKNELVRLIEKQQVIIRQLRSLDMPEEITDMCPSCGTKTTREESPYRCRHCGKTLIWPVPEREHMQKANIDTMEIGNLIFGHSRGNYAIPRDTWQEPFAAFLEQNGFDGYGYKDDTNDAFFENDIFSIRPYYWGDDDTIAELPDFVYKPNRLTISWYKYPLRDAYSSHDITVEEFKKILAHCARSLNGG